MGIHYEKDFYAWTQEQANLIRQGKFNEIDTLHIIDEIESMGRSEKRALKSRLAVLLMHLLKWQCITDMTIPLHHGLGLTE